eukprot:6453210-Alexandrium_andersonii.AAC.1
MAARVGAKPKRGAWASSDGARGELRLITCRSLARDPKPGVTQPGRTQRHGAAADAATTVATAACAAALGGGALPALAS